MAFSRKIKRRFTALFLPLVLLTGCVRAANAVPELPAARPEPSPAARLEQSPATLRISELMGKNRAVLRDGDGDFSDWIEIENYGDEAVVLAGFSLSDGGKKAELPLSGVIAPGEQRVYWASGKDRPEEGHAAFSLSEGESVYLLDTAGRAISTAPCLTDAADRSVALKENGEYAETCYPTPGWPNTAAGYVGRQETQYPQSPLLIQEVCVSNPGTDAWRLFDSDWVELKNVSDEAILLSDYSLSDDAERPDRYRLPDKLLPPGALFLLRCDERTEKLPDPSAGFALSSEGEQLYLSRADGALLDWVPLQGIPYGGSFGRMEGEPGWFYFAEASPAQENAAGCRRVSARPTLTTREGVYEGVDSVRVELTAPGAIYYSLGDETPDSDSERYLEPFTLEETAVVRAIAVEEGALPSGSAEFTFVINEGHTLPVLSLVTKSGRLFDWTYLNSNKERELPATLSLCDGEGGFSAPCGVRLHGETSLALAKKNMSVAFRSRYGQRELCCDLYGGGVERFENLVLRAGQDYYHTAVKNALCQNLCLQAENRAVTGRSKLCVLYINGSYWGIYNLMEKTNERFYADLLGVSKQSVEVIESPADRDDSVYGLFDYLRGHDLSLPENYEQAQTLLDIDNVIDWVILEGYTGNTDLTYGNVRYARSSEGDGKWRLMFYDLDATFWDDEVCFRNMLLPGNLQTRQVSACVVRPLLESPAFRDRLLRRAAELFGGVLSQENVLGEFDRLIAEIEPEIERDYRNHGLQKSKWESDVAELRAKLDDDAWNKSCLEQLCYYLNLTAEEREYYFGDLYE